MQRKYDYILLLDIPVKNEEELEGYLRTAGKLLNTGGHIYFATDNKYGLKYWAGNRERFTHDFLLVWKATWVMMGELAFLGIS